MTAGRSLVAALALGAGLASAQPGPGMMGGYGMGMGPGMMGGCGMSMGMSPGTMGGYGTGMGAGMMGGTAGGAWMPDLNESQRTELTKIQDESRKRHWELMGRMQDEMAKMRDAMWGGKRDRTAIVAALDRMHEIRKQGVAQMLDTTDRVEGLLTPEQREQFRRRNPMWMMNGGVGQ